MIQATKILLLFFSLFGFAFDVNAGEKATKPRTLRPAKIRLRPSALDAARIGSRGGTKKSRLGGSKHIVAIPNRLEA
jgi:hypothetical protein